MASSEYEQGRYVPFVTVRTPEPSLKLPALCRTSEEEVTITRMLDKVLRWSDALDKESLCIVAGQRVCSFNLR